jgi:protein phosphatase
MAAPGESLVADTAEYLHFEQFVARFYELEPRVVVQFDCGARTHTGKVRDHNEDQYLVIRRRREREILRSTVPPELLPDPEQHAYILAVADGMGGHHFGELASLLALRAGWDLGGGEIKWAVKINDQEIDELRKKATIFFQLLHRTLVAHGEESPRLRGMGTTLTICYTVGPELFVMHAGDSRAYLFRQGNLQRLTHDHTLAQVAIDAGEIQPGSPEEKRVRHILTSALGGGFGAVTVNFNHHRLEDGDTLLLCTDGLTDHLNDDEIARVLQSQPQLDPACSRLVELALEQGGKDNVTVVIGRYHFATETLEPVAASTLPGLPK